VNGTGGVRAVKAVIPKRSISILILKQKGMMPLVGRRDDAFGGEKEIGNRE